MPSSRLLGLAALALLVALAGCGGPAASLSMTELSDRELADRSSIDTTDLSHDSRSVAVGAVENGSTNASGQRPPFDPALPVRHEGRYYNVSDTVVGSRQATRYDIEVTVASANATGETVAYEDLPAVDRRVLAGPLARPIDEDDSPTVGVSRAYTAAEVNESRLVPDPEFDYVTDDGERYRVAVTGSRPDTVETYLYTATEVAETHGAYADYLRDRYLFSFTDLSAEERDVVEEAVDGEYQNDDELTPAFRSLVDRFRAHRGVTEDEFEDGDYYGGQYLVEYEGTVYWAQLTLRDAVSTTP